MIMTTNKRLIISNNDRIPFIKSIKNTDSINNNILGERYEQIKIITNLRTIIVMTRNSHIQSKK